MKKPDKSKLGRRDFLRAMGAGAGLAAADATRTAGLGVDAFRPSSTAGRTPRVAGVALSRGLRSAS